jgi:hypothetical protein
MHVNVRSVGVGVRMCVHAMTSWELFFSPHFFSRQFGILNCLPRGGLMMRGPDGTGRDSFIYRPAAKGKIASDARSVLVHCCLLACHHLLLRSPLIQPGSLSPYSVCVCSHHRIVRAIQHSLFIHMHLYWQ